MMPLGFVTSRLHYICLYFWLLMKTLILSFALGSFSWASFLPAPVAACSRAFISVNSFCLPAPVVDTVQVENWGRILLSFWSPSRLTPIFNLILTACQFQALFSSPYSIRRVVLASNLSCHFSLFEGLCVLCGLFLYAFFSLTHAGSSLKSSDLSCEFGTFCCKILLFIGDR